MVQIEKWKWRIRWAGQWRTTRIAFAEAEIRREHPEAKRLKGSMILIDVPESGAEVSAQRPARGSAHTQIGASTAKCGEANVVPETCASIRVEAEALLALGWRPSPNDPGRMYPLKPFMASTMTTAEIWLATQEIVAERKR